MENTTVILMPIALIPKDRSAAPVIRDTLEMDSRALVSYVCLSKSNLKVTA